MNNTADNLFAACFPTGISYADKSKEEDGDYKRIAFLSYSTLQLTIYAPQSDLLPAIMEDVTKMQARQGEEFRIAGNSTITLGYALKEGMTACFQQVIRQWTPKTRREYVQTQRGTTSAQGDLFDTQCNLFE